MRRKILFVLSLLAFISCSEYEETRDSGDNATVISEVEIPKGKSATSLDDFVELSSSVDDLSQTDADAINNSIEIIRRTYLANIVKITIKYPSIDASGKPIMLSGCIFYNKKAKSFNEIVLYAHQTTFDDSDVPSGWGYGTIEPNVLSQNTETIIFASDYVGFGITKDKIHPYMNQDLAARNQIDMLKAGLTFMKSSNDKPHIISAAEGLKTYIVGYSQGGAVALATHRALEADKTLCQDVNFKGSYCGAGPFDLETTYDLFKSQKIMILPALLPYVLMGMYESYPDYFRGIDINDYLSDKAIRSNAIGYLERKPMTQDVMVWFPLQEMFNLESVMSEEAMDESSALWQTFAHCMQKQNLIDGSWTPKHKVVLYHSSGDDIVSYENSVKAYHLWKESGNCFITGPKLKLGHVAAYATYMLTIVDGKYRVDVEY